MCSGSSSAQGVTALPQDAKKQNSAFLRAVNCSGNDNQQVECLRNINRQKLLSLVSKQQPKWFCASNPYFSPVFDSDFLQDTPVNLLKKGDFKKCSILNGVCEKMHLKYDEILFFFYINLNRPKRMTETVLSVNRHYLMPKTLLTISHDTQIPL